MLIKPAARAPEAPRIEPSREPAGPLVYSNDDNVAVAPEAGVNYIYQKRLDNMVKEENYLRAAETAMYADYMRNLSREAHA